MNGNAIEHADLGKKSNRARSNRNLLLLIAVLSSSIASSVLAQAGLKPSPDAWQGVEAAALKEGKVVLYGTAVVTVVQRLKTDFDKAHPGLVLEFARYTGSAFSSRLAQERDTGADGADVVITTELAWIEDRTKEKSLKTPLGPSVSTWPLGHILGGVAPVLALEPLIIAYNTNLAKTSVTGYADVLRPEYKGQFGTADLGTGTSVALAWYDWLEKTQGAEFLSRLAAQQPRLYSSTTVGAQQVAAGEYAVAYFVAPGSVIPLIERGAPLKIVIPNPSFGFRYVGALPGWSKRPNSAQVFLNYLMSRRGQSIWHGQGETASPLANIPGSLDAKALNPYDPAPFTPEVVNSFRDRWGKLFAR